MKNIIVISKCVLAFSSLLFTHQILSIFLTADIVYGFVFTPALAMGIAKMGMSGYNLIKGQEEKKTNKRERERLLARQQAEINKIYNPLAAAQTSDRGEQLALDQSKEVMAGLTNNLYSAEQTAQATNLVRAQQQQALQIGAGLSQREDATNMTRLQGEKDAMMTKANMTMDMISDEKSMNEAQRQEIAARKNINQEAMMSGAGQVIEGAVQGSSLYTGDSYKKWASKQGAGADTSRDAFKSYKRDIMSTTAGLGGGSGGGGNSDVIAALIDYLSKNK